MLNVDYYSPAIQVRNEFYSGTHGALLAYDVTNRASFEALGSWLLEMRSHLADPDQDMASLVVVVCANKVCMYVCTLQLQLLQCAVWLECEMEGIQAPADG